MEHIWIVSKRWAKIIQQRSAKSKENQGLTLSV